MLQRGRCGETFVASHFQLKFQIFPELRTPSLDLRLHSLDDAFIADAVLDPASTVIVEIQENGHAAIDSFREAGLVRLTRIELLPEIDEFSVDRGINELVCHRRDLRDRV